MKVVFVTPEYHQARGNTVTVRRITELLQQKGVTTEVVSLTDGRTYNAPLEATVVHGFNAYRFGEYWKAIGRPSIPYVVTMTGTDLNHDLFNEERKKCVVETLYGAERIHLFNERARDTLIKALPAVNDKTVVIPQGVARLPAGPQPVKEEHGHYIFLLPAGIRKVKNVPEAISMLKSLHSEYPYIQLWIAGPVIEQTEFERVVKLVERHKSWVKYLGEVDFGRMGELYGRANTVLNTSLSEGQSSAILESMAHGVPVLAAANEGNSDIIKHGKNGLLYHNREEFTKYAEQLITDDAFREQLGSAGSQYVNRHHRPENESEQLLHIYNSIIEKGKCNES